MGQGPSLVVVLVAGLVAGGLGGYVAGVVAAPDAAPADGSAAAAEQAAALARLKERVDALALATRPPRAGATPSPIVPPSGAPAPSGGAADSAGTRSAGDDRDAAPTRDSDAWRALEARVAALESGGRTATVIPADLSKLAPAESEALLRNLMAEKRFTDALRVADEISRRGDLTADQRADADLNAGYALRSMGKHPEAEARFRETLARVGEQSEKGVWVLFQVAWERYYQKDLAGASADMERVANHTATTPILRVHGLYNGGTFANQAGDPARARNLLDRLVRDHAADIPASQTYMRTEAERIVKAIDGG